MKSLIHIKKLALWSSIQLCVSLCVNSHEWIYRCKVIRIDCLNLFLMRKSRDLYSKHVWGIGPSLWASSPIPYDNKVINLIHFYNTISNNLYSLCNSFFENILMYSLRVFYLTSESDITQSCLFPEISWFWWVFLCYIGHVTSYYLN